MAKRPGGQRAAAGARLESRDGDAVARLYAAWPLIAETHAPGTVIQQALVDVDEAGGLAATQRQLGERLHALLLRRETPFSSRASYKALPFRV